MKSEVKENNIDFSLIRYSQCWEDTEILLSALDISEGDICLGIASAGDNIFSMLTKNPEKVIGIDLSFPQLALVRLKSEAVKNLSYEEMLFFFGVLPDLPSSHPSFLCPAQEECPEKKRKEDRRKKKGKRAGKKPEEKRIEIYEKLKGNLDEKTAEYWDFNIREISGGINHMGKFERFFRLFREKILPFIHTEKRIRSLLENKSYEERVEFYNKKWCNLRWKLVFRIFFSNYIVGKLGRDKEFFRYVEKDISKVMKERVKYALCEMNPCENPYLNYILTGNYSLECLPYFLRKENFGLIKRNIHKLEIAESSIEEYLNESDIRIDKFNLSDIFEYMSQENYEKLMDRIYKNAKDSAVLAYWNLAVPRNSEINGYGRNKFQRNSSKGRELHKKDRTFFYTDFIIEEVIKDAGI